MKLKAHLKNSGNTTAGVTEEDKFKEPTNKLVSQLKMPIVWYRNN